jgi:HK97 gp10 family phage protein
MSKEVEGLKELIASLEKIKGSNLNKALLKGAFVLQRASMKNAPVKTGFLRQSHESHETEQGAEMVVNANYAYYQEFGTVKMAGKGYVRKAIETEKDAIENAVAKEAVKEFREGLK